jgi:AraC family transcriptional regulator
VLWQISIDPYGDFRLKHAARLAYVAPFHFHRLFRELVGKPIGRYVRDLKLEYSLYQLLCSQESILQIALQAGFGSHEAFTRAFARGFGLLPSTLRSCQPLLSSEVTSRSSPIAGLLTCLRVPQGGHSVAHMPRRTVLFRPHFGPYKDVSECWRRFILQLREARCEMAGAQAIGVLYDDPVVNSSVRYDACVAVVTPRRLPPVGIQVLPEMSYISIAHQGEPFNFFHGIRLMTSWALTGDGRGCSLPCYELFEQVPGVGKSAKSKVCVEVK